MKKVIVSDIKDTYKYYLLDEKGKVYPKSMEFYSLVKPNVNDVIYISDELLKVNYHLAFDDLKNSKHVIETDIIKVTGSNKEYFLTRQYG